MRNRWITPALAVAALAAPAFAAPDLKVGDPAPAVDIGHTFQGTPVKAFDKEKTYVLEFWATW